MARKIADQTTATATEETQKGSIFVKNHTNELIRFTDGTTYKFTKSREVITDPDLAEKLRKAKPTYGIFEVTPAAT